jgi:hypothetical protein
MNAEWNRSLTQFDVRVAQVAIETASEPTAGWWLSFCDTDRPAGQQFLGACLVRAGSLPEAITVSHLLGVNPGGEIEILGPIPPEKVDKIPLKWVNRLLSREEIDEFDAVMEEIDA